MMSEQDVSPHQIRDLLPVGLKQPFSAGELSDAWDLLMSGSGQDDRQLLIDIFWSTVAHSNWELSDSAIELAQFVGNARDDYPGEPWIIELLFGRAEYTHLFRRAFEQVERRLHEVAFSVANALGQLDIEGPWSDDNGTCGRGGA